MRRAPARPAWRPSSPARSTRAGRGCSTAGATTTSPCRTSRGCRRSTSSSPPCRSPAGDAVTAELAPLAQLLTRAEWLAAPTPSTATVDPDAARYRTYGAFAALLAEAAPARARARGPRRPALGRDRRRWPCCATSPGRGSRAGSSSSARSATPATRSPSRWRAAWPTSGGSTGVDPAAPRRARRRRRRAVRRRGRRPRARRRPPPARRRAGRAQRRQRVLPRRAVAPPRRDRRRRPRAAAAGRRPGAGRRRARQRARRRRCPPRRPVAVRPAGHRPRRALRPADRPAGARAGGRPGPRRARCRGRRARRGRAARRRSPARPWSTGSSTPSCATPSRPGSPAAGGHACTSTWPRRSRPPTRPTAGRCWPSWPATSPRPRRSAGSTRPSTTAAGPPPRRCGRRRTTRPSPTSMSCSGSTTGRSSAAEVLVELGTRRAAPGVVQGEPGRVPRGVRDRHRARRRRGGGRRRGGLRDGDALPRSARRPGGGDAPPGPRHDRRRRVGGPGPGDGHARAGPGVRRAVRGGVGDGGVRGRPRPRRR